jgi:hydrogenase expression/formation protein HypE
MGPTIPPGKVPADLLSRLLASFGPPPPDVRLGPAIGEDACALQVGDDVLVAATDPITLTTGDLGRYAVIVNANDVAVCGVRPRWFLATVLLPLATTTADVEDLFVALREGLDDVGAALVGGHTEVTGAVSQPVVVGQMLGVADAGRVVSTAGARPGDAVVQVGPAPIEGAAVLAAEAGDRLDALRPEVLAAALDAPRRPGISVVEAALTAAGAGARALHDPTEGGVAAGLHELALAADVGIRLDRAAVVWFGPGVEVCRALGADPWATLASGSLLATFAEDALEGALDALAGAGLPGTVIGRVEAGQGVVDRDGAPVAWPERDEVPRVLAG